MIRNYLKILGRTIIKHTGYAVINIVGLVVGVTVCLLAYVFVNYEKEFDKFYPANIYRLCELKQEPGQAGITKVAQTVFPAGPAIKSDLAGIADFCRITSSYRVPLQPPGKPAVMGMMSGADPSLLSMFNLPIIAGNRETALINPRSIVITESFAHALFGNINVVGQLLHHEGRDTIDYLITGLLKDLPPQSHLQFDALYSMSTHVGLDTVNNWDQDWIFTYLQLTEGADSKKIEAGLSAVQHSHNPVTRQSDNDKKPLIDLFLQPLYDVHLRSNDITRDSLNTSKFNGSYLTPLIIIAILVLALAIINYINLTTARSFTRMKEIGVRKTSGGTATQIRIQMIFETMMFCLIAFVLSVLITLILMPAFGRLSDRPLNLDLGRVPFLIACLSGACILTGVIAGIIPALTLARHHPVKTQQSMGWSNNSIGFRSVLVVTQFSISIVLAIVCLNMFRQLKFIQHYDAGFRKDAIIVVPVSYTDKQKEEVMMADMKKIPGVIDVTGSLRRLGSADIDRNKIIVETSGNRIEMTCDNLFVDYNYCEMYGITLLAGRYLSPAFGADRNRQSFIINHTLAQQLLGQGVANAKDVSSLIGTRIRYSFDDSTGTIVGIVKDFNFRSLHYRVEPLCITYQNEYYFSDLSVRIDPSMTGKVLSDLQSVWRQFLPGQQFSYYFLDQQLQSLYRSDIQTTTYLSLFTALAIFVASIGAIGMAVFNIERRRKEIGIRKVLGASVAGIVGLLSKNFLKLVIISFIIAVPLALIVTMKWMENFSYRIAISWWVFAICGLATILLAQLTIIYQAAKAAMANPVESLKTE